LCEPVELHLDQRSFGYWDVKTHAWLPSSYEHAGTPSRDIRQTAAVERN
jgi:hypothetical protein